MSTEPVPLLQNVNEAADWLRACSVSHIHSHTGLIQAGDAFIAWPGSAVDARQYVTAALERGAGACLIDADGLEKFQFTDPRIRAVPHLKAQAGAIAAALYNHPGQRVQTMAVTGTNGKTSVSWWLAQALQHLDIRCAIAGTLGMGEPPSHHHKGQALEPTGLTTPDPIRLQTALYRWSQLGIQACALEASSIGIVEHRLGGLPIHTAVFTNFTQDHLDYHGTMENYWQAKRQLFDAPDLRCAVVNTDDAKGLELAAYLRKNRPDVSLWTYGLDEPTKRSSSTQQHLQAQAIEIQSHGMHFQVDEGYAEPIQTELIGRFNVANILAVMACLRAWGYTLAQAASAAKALRPVPGRLERILSPEENTPSVLVDYAHTPDALLQVLQTLQGLAHVRAGKLWCVFGCGGDRDPIKRPLMGQVAQQYAERCVVTSDNPRSENPMRIIDDIMAGMTPSPQIHVEPDRAQAITYAMTQAQPNDVVLLAGKGHESYQEIAGIKYVFSDLEQAQIALALRRSKTLVQEGV
jgi:UDP-N-acetylmuramyl-tripeptide synthetase